MKARLLEILKELRKENHDSCEDPWYACPSHPDYIGGEPRDYCNCWLAENNALVDEAVKIVEGLGEE